MIEDFPLLGAGHGEPNDECRVARSLAAEMSDWLKAQDQLDDSTTSMTSFWAVDYLREICDHCGALFLGH